MRHTARWVALGVALVVIAVGIVLATQVGDDPRADSTRSQLVGDPAPPFTVRTLDGENVSLDDLAGRAVIVNFWNSWCVPCHQELPALKEFADRHRDDPSVAFVGIVRDDTRRAISEYVEDEGVDWTVAMDPGARASLDFGTRGQPETFAISPDGVVAGAQIGPSTLADLETMLAAAQGRRR